MGINPGYLLKCFLLYFLYNLSNFSPFFLSIMMLFADLVIWYEAYKFWPITFINSMYIFEKRCINEKNTVCKNQNQFLWPHETWLTVKNGFKELHKTRFKDSLKTESHWISQQHEKIKNSFFKNSWRRNSKVYVIQTKSLDCQKYEITYVKTLVWPHF